MTNQRHVSLGEVGAEALVELVDKRCQRHLCAFLASGAHFGRTLQRIGLPDLQCHYRGLASNGTMGAPPATKLVSY